MLKSSPISDLLRAVRAVAGGEAYVDPALSPTLLMDPDAADAPLGARERDVLQLLAEGLRTEDVAERLGLSAETVKAGTKRAIHSSRPPGACMPWPTRCGAPTSAEIPASAQRRRSSRGSLLLPAKASARLASNPITPATMRMVPTVGMSMPATSAVTAYRRMAPKANRKIEAPIDIVGIVPRFWIYMQVLIVIFVVASMAIAVFKLS